VPPIPGLRFNETYLKQLEVAKGSVTWMIIASIREQVLFPGLRASFGISWVADFTDETR